MTESTAEPKHIWELFDETSLRVLTLGVVLDQVTKGLANTFLAGHALIPVVDGYVDLHHVNNPDVLFGFLTDMHWLPRIFASKWLVGLVQIPVIYAYTRTTPSQRVLRMSLALILAGGFSNLFDRIKSGAVVDFINLHFGHSGAWLTINLADLCIAAGALLLAWHLSIDPAAHSPLPSERP